MSATDWPGATNCRMTSHMGSCCIRFLSNRSLTLSRGSIASTPLSRRFIFTPFRPMQAPARLRLRSPTDRAWCGQVSLYPSNIGQLCWIIQQSYERQLGETAEPPWPHRFTADTTPDAPSVNAAPFSDVSGLRRGLIPPGSQRCRPPAAFSAWMRGDSWVVQPQPPSKWDRVRPIGSARRNGHEDGGAMLPVCVVSCPECYVPSANSIGTTVNLIELPEFRIRGRWRNP
jgi:hypothetical protein